MNHSAKVAELLNEESNSISLGPGPCFTHLVRPFKLGSSSWVIGNVYLELDYWHPLNYLYESLCMSIYNFTLRYTHTIPGLQQERERTRTMNTDERLSSSFHPSLNSLSELTALQIYIGLE